MPYLDTVAFAHFVVLLQKRGDTARHMQSELPPPTVNMHACQAAATDVHALPQAAGMQSKRALFCVTAHVNVARRVVDWTVSRGVGQQQLLTDCGVVGNWYRTLSPSLSKVGRCSERESEIK